MKKIFLLIFLTSMVFGAHPSSSYTLDTVLDDSEVIKIYKNGFKIMSASNPTRIAIGNPTVIGVGQVSKKEFTIVPKGVGVTTLVLWDDFGEQSYKIKVFAENVDELKARVDNLLGKLNLPEVYSQAEEDEGKVFILGRVKTSQDRERVFTVLAALKNKIVDLIQIKEEETILDIDVQIIEIDKDSTNTLGFTWPGSINFAEVGSPGLAAAGTTWGKVFKVANIMRGSGGVAAPFTVKLDALIQEGKAHMLSRPRIACQSGKEAELLVGGEQPIFTTQIAQTTGAQGTSVEYKEYGIKFKIKPTLTDDKRIKLGVNVEVSDLGAVQSIGSTGAGTTTTTAQAYPLTKRSAVTELFLDSGQSMAIGGLIRKKKEETITRIPFLSNIPVLGAIFRQKVSRTGGGEGAKMDTELIIILTPTIVTMDKDKTQTKREISPVTAPQEQSLDPVTKYSNIVQQRITQKITYPSSAKGAGFQGTVKLSLNLSYKGELLDSKIKSSSGYRILDDDALSVVKNISPDYPPFPPAIASQDLWIDIPINYQLD
ncbi:MAG: TonB family protein [Candidatus Omnitrophica bacterium]|nr:TonB family protein [Candidatus Omnitrophota bacterium]